MQKKQWSELKTWQKSAIIVMALGQISLFVAAWTDLSRRQPDSIRGSKTLWRAALLINTIGPLTYFLQGRRR